ncbi:MAG: hypothetical protein ACYTFT_07830, partial [Planctomycetota bacterium]
KRVGEAWRDSDASSPSAAVAEALTAALEAAGPDSKPDAAIVEITYDFRTRTPMELTRIGNVHRGILGVDLHFGTHSERLSPTRMIARNLSFPRALQRFGEKLRMPGAEAFGGPGLTIRTFRSRAFLIELGPAPQVTELYRGNVLVPQSEVTKARAATFAQAMGRHLFAQLDPSGAMTYKYWPSRGQTSPANNLIRQLMATVALGRFARHQGDDEALLTLATQNLRRNLELFYREESELGFVEWAGKVKLGAVALAALAILESKDPSRFANEQAAFDRFIGHMRNPGGSFRTFHKPEGRTDCENFYPGEALLYWASLWRRTGAKGLLQRILESFRYYRTWHRNQRNPAFIPWHTQAYYQVWEATQDPELASFIFEMNDWLLGMQQVASALHPDVRGRFYDPNRQHFGPPHASSTGVYLEGLIDAFCLARTLGDAERLDRYRLAILRGLRSSMQLQFKGAADAFYVSKKGPVLGGLRTTVYDNSLRIDNTQHTLMATLKVLEAFTASDWEANATA